MASTASNRKPVAALTALDFDRYPIWLVENTLLFDHAAPAAPFEDLLYDEPYIAATNYHFSNGATARGYCFIYDHTGFTLFTEEGHAIPISDYTECSNDEAQRLSTALGRPLESIFPIRYRAMVKVLGDPVEGYITMQPNPPLNPDAPRSGAPVS